MKCIQRNYINESSSLRSNINLIVLYKRQETAVKETSFSGAYGKKWTSVL